MEVMHSYNGNKVHLANSINDCTNFQPQKRTASITPLRDQPAPDGVEKVICLLWNRHLSWT